MVKIANIFNISEIFIQKTRMCKFYMDVFLMTANGHKDIPTYCELYTKK